MRDALAPTPWRMDVTRRLVRYGIRTSFWCFMCYGYGLRINPLGRKWFVRRVHKPWCDWIQRQIERWHELRQARALKRPYAVLTLGYRGGGKSFLFTKGASLWMHIRVDPNLATVISSSDATKSAAFLQSNIAVLMGLDPNAWLVWALGPFFDKDRLWTTTALVHSRRTLLSRSEPSFSTTSIEKGGTSTHPDAFLLDDPIGFEQIKPSQRTDTAAIIAQANTHLESMAYVIEQDGFSGVTMTPYDHSDPSQRALYVDGFCELAGLPLKDADLRPTREGIWHVFHLPVRGPDGKSIHPERWSNEAIAHEYRTKPSKAASQLDLTLTRTGDEKLKDEDIRWIKRQDLFRPEDTLLCVHTDTALKDQEENKRAKGDWTVLIVSAHAIDGSGRIQVFDIKAGREYDSPLYVKHLIRLVQKWRRLGYNFKRITDERTGAGKEDALKTLCKTMFAARRVQCPPIHLIPRGNKRDAKFERMSLALDYVKAGYAEFREDCPHIDQLVGQLMTLSKQMPHDDFADAFTDTFDPNVYRGRVLDDDGEVAPVDPRAGDDELRDGHYPTAEEAMIADALAAARDGLPDRAPVGLEFDPNDDDWTDVLGQIGERHRAARESRMPV